ncbi:MAG: rhodanese-like domain-containing protein [Gemmatimonadales bacterium]
MVTYCHHGVRSRHAAELLRAAGFASVRSLRGGIDAWSREVNPSVPRY